MRQLGETAPGQRLLRSHPPRPRRAPRTPRLGLRKPCVLSNRSLNAPPPRLAAAAGGPRPLSAGSGVPAGRAGLGLRGRELGGETRLRGRPLLCETADPEAPAASTSSEPAARRGDGTHPANIPVTENHSRLGRRHDDNPSAPVGPGCGACERGFIPDLSGRGQREPRLGSAPAVLVPSLRVSRGPRAGLTSAAPGVQRRATPRLDPGRARCVRWGSPGLELRAPQGGSRSPGSPARGAGPRGPGSEGSGYARGVRFVLGILI